MRRTPGPARYAARLVARGTRRRLRSRANDASRGGPWVAVLLALLLPLAVAHAATAFIDGEAIYLERIMPPPGAVLVVSLQDTARADAPAIERASVSLQLASGPPYAWRIAYDPALGDPARLALRARITTAAGLWMTTTQVVSAATTPVALRLSLVNAPPAAPPPKDDCAAATTQSDLNRCAYDEFLAANAAYAERYRSLQPQLVLAQRDRLRRMQSAWLGFRTAACRYESGLASGGRAEGFAYWRCAARMTRERVEALSATAACREGDVTCSRRTF